MTAPASPVDRVSARLTRLDRDPADYHLSEVAHDLRDTIPGGGACTDALFLAIAEPNRKDPS